MKETFRKSIKCANTTSRNNKHCRNSTRLGDDFASTENHCLFQIVHSRGKICVAWWSVVAVVCVTVTIAIVIIVAVVHLVVKKKSRELEQTKFRANSWWKSVKPVTSLVAEGYHISRASSSAESFLNSAETPSTYSGQRCSQTYTPSSQSKRSKRYTPLYLSSPFNQSRYNGRYTQSSYSTLLQSSSSSDEE